MKEASYKMPHVAWSHLYEMSRKGKSIETESGLLTAKGWGEGAMVMIGNEVMEML